MSTPDVSIVIVTYNSRGTIGRALDAARPAVDAGRAEVIVVDNVSRDGTREHVRGAYPWVTLVESPGNVGYGRGCNQGLARASGRHILFQNPDAEVGLEALTRLARLLDETPRAGLVGPCILGPGGHLQPCGRLTTPWNILADTAGIPLARSNRRAIHPGEAPFRTDWLGGPALMGRTTLLREIGGFDPRFFLYFDETDLCKRIGDLGHELWACGEAVTRHAHGVSARGTGRALYLGNIGEHYFQSRCYYLCKHYGIAAAALADLGDYACCGLRVLRRLLAGLPAGEAGERLKFPVLRCPRRPTFGRAPRV